MNAERDALAEVLAGHLPTGEDNIAEGLIGCSCGTPVRANFEGAGGYIAGVNQAMQIHVADAIRAAGWTRATTAPLIGGPFSGLEVRLHDSFVPPVILVDEVEYYPVLDPDTGEFLHGYAVRYDGMMRGD